MKSRKLSDIILEEFPENHKELIYCEPFCGCCNVFLKKDHSEITALNDLNNGISNFLTVLRDDGKKAIGKLKKINYNQQTFKKELKRSNFKNNIDYAINQYILYRTSRGGLCKNYCYSKTKRKKIEDIESWNTNVENLNQISLKLSDVFIFNSPASEIIGIFNSENVLMYCDPPRYVNNRKSQCPYKDYMTEEEHVELSKILLKSNSKIILSGSDSLLYKKLYKEWVRRKISNKNKKEFIWKNF
jgi:DNA adenine methylase